MAAFGDHGQLGFGHCVDDILGAIARYRGVLRAHDDQRRHGDGGKDRPLVGTIENGFALARIDLRAPEEGEATGSALAEYRDNWST